MANKCLGCGIELQYTKPEEIGFAMNETVKYCQRCYKMKNFNQVPDTFLDNEEFIKILKEVGASKKPVVWVVDLFDFAGSYLELVEKYLKKNPIILVGNKIDLLPRSVNENKIKSWMIEQIDQDIDIYDIELISAERKRNIDDLMKKLRKYRTDKIYVIGITNAGKSTLINQMVKSINPGQETGIVTSYYAGTTLGMIDVKLDERLTITDTPGIINEHQLNHRVESNTLKQIIPKKEVRPITYQLMAEQTLFISGFVQFDFLEGEKTGFTVYASNQLNIHRTKLENAEELRANHLGEKLLTPPSKNDLAKISGWEVHEFTIKYPKTDIVISGLGWIVVNKIKGPIKVRVKVPSGVKVQLRESIV